MKYLSMSSLNMHHKPRSEALQEKSSLCIQTEEDVPCFEITVNLHIVVKVLHGLTGYFTALAGEREHLCAGSRNHRRIQHAEYTLPCHAGLGCRFVMLAMGLGFKIKDLIL